MQYESTIENGFRLLACVKDKPGALFLILKTLGFLTLEEENNESINNSDNMINLKYITLETCERFARIESTNFSSTLTPRSIVYLKPKIRFHAILEIINQDNMNKKKILSVLELNVCMTKGNVLKSLIYLLNGVLSNEIAKIPLDTSIRPINKYIIIFPRYALKQAQLSILKKKLNGILNSLSSEKQENCSKMGTCPLAYLDRKDDNIEETLTNINVDINYIRDYGCYSENTLLDIMGTILSSSNSSSEINIEALTLDVHYVHTEFEKNLSKYMDIIKDKLLEEDFLVNIGVSPNGNSMLYAKKAYHTCEYYYCYIVKSLKYTLKLGGKNNEVT